MTWLARTIGIASSVTFLKRSIRLSGIVVRAFGGFGRRVGGQLFFLAEMVVALVDRNALFNEVLVNCNFREIY